MDLVKKYIIPIFLLWIFLTPSVVKFVHQHEPAFHCTAKYEKHYHSFHEKCPICAFHFSLFKQEQKYFDISTKEVYRRFIYSYKIIFVKKLFCLSLLLRGPPVSNDLVSYIYFKS